MPDLRKWAFISLGSNRGESVSILTQAMKALTDLNPHHQLRSSLWRSAPIDCPPGSPDFLNAVVGVLPDRNASPESFFAELQRLVSGRPDDGAVVQEPAEEGARVLVFARASD